MCPQTAIWLMADHVSPDLKSAGDKLLKSLSKGQQTFQERKDLWPMGQPVPKVESNVQVSGEWRIEPSTRWGIF